MVYLAIPGLPPSSNNAYFNLPHGGRTLTTSGRKYLTETKVYIAQRFPQAMQQFRRDVPYLIVVRFTLLNLLTKGWPKTAKNRYKVLDVSNRIKLFEDALKDAAGIDDAQNMTIILDKVQGDNELTELWAWNLELEKNPFDDALRSL